MSELTVSRLSDGRIQLFTLSSKKLFTRFQPLDPADGEWTDWLPFDSPKGAVVESIAASQSEQDRPYLFAIDNEGRPWKRRKLTVKSDSFWGPWEKDGKISG